MSRYSTFFIGSSGSSSVEGGLVYQESYNATTNTPDLDTSPSGIKKGYMYTVTVAGTFFTAPVEVGDALIAEKDDPTLETDWTILNKNLDGVQLQPSEGAFVDGDKTTLDGIVAIYAPKIVLEVVQAATDTLTASECSGTTISNYGQSAENTQTLPTAVAGLSGVVEIGTAGAGAFHLKAGATDKIYLDGNPLDDGDKVSLSIPVVADFFSFKTFKTGASTYDWIVRTGQGALLGGGA